MPNISMIKKLANNYAQDNIKKKSELNNKKN